MDLPVQGTQSWSSGALSGHGSIAYFSMEIAVSPKMPTYSGGLGVLAGDTLRSAADLGLPLAAVTLVHHKGYFPPAPGRPRSAERRESALEPYRTPGDERRRPSPSPLKAVRFW